MSTYNRLMNCYKNLQEKIDFKPQIGIVLDDDFKNLATTIMVEKIVPYTSIENLLPNNISACDGQFVFGQINGINVVIMQGRLHYYEGISMDDVVLPIRLMGILGIKALLLTSIDRGISYGYRPGDFMLVKDHISSFVPSTLIGKNFPKLGPRFLDMSIVYDKEFRKKIKIAANHEVISLQEGVLLQLSGPNFETPAESKMFRTIGADVLSMSTACEAIAARHMGVRVAGLSFISSMTADVANTTLSSDEIDISIKKMSEDFNRLIKSSIKEIAKDI